jgi:hypothetical protein
MRAAEPSHNLPGCLRQRIPQRREVVVKPAYAVSLIEMFADDCRRSHQNHTMSANSDSALRKYAIPIMSITNAARMEMEVVDRAIGLPSIAHRKPSTTPTIGLMA